MERPTSFWRVGYWQIRINCTPYPPIGGGTLTQGPKIHSRHHLAPPKKLWPHKLKYKALKSVKLGALSKKSAYRPTLQLLWTLWKQGICTLQLCCGPFESKVTYLYITVTVGPLWTQGTLHITVAIGGPLKA